jgi:hypothetical protein
MNISRLLACFTAATLLVACSDQQESSVEQIADEVKTATETAAEDVAVAEAAEEETAAIEEEEEEEEEEEAEAVE